MGKRKHKHPQVKPARLPTGQWGVRSSERLDPGTAVTVTTSQGKRWDVTIIGLDFSDGNGHVYTTTNRSNERKTRSKPILARYLVAAAAFGIALALVSIQLRIALALEDIASSTERLPVRGGPCTDSASPKT